ncbi:MAG TPA: hypothetical protein VJ788_07515, partial [Gemmatimonadota bacterium]|nr:hypothetical protein [Gemmatimonadota bacterium]
MTARSSVLPTATELALWRQREAELDRSGMRAHVAAFGSRLEAALAPARDFAGRLEHGPVPSAIAVLGMGGSAVAGDLAAAAVGSRGTLPIATIRSP